MIQQSDVPELGFAPLLAMAPSLLSSVGSIFGQQSQLKAQKSAQKNQLLLTALKMMQPQPVQPKTIIQRVPVPVPVPVQQRAPMQTSPVQTRQTGISNNTLLIGGGAALVGLLLFMQK